MKRCAWVGETEIDQEYHDREWGVEVRDDARLFECLTLEGAQAGLSWLTILKKREGYRRCFAGFDPRKVAGFSEEKVQALLKDAAIVRHEGKIRSAINNAQRVLEIQEEFGSLAGFLWGLVGGARQLNAWESLDEIPAQTEVSRAMSKELKKRGFGFVGPTTCYAFMQAVGMVNDHEVGCFRYKEV